MAAGQVHHARLCLAAGRAFQGFLQPPRGVEGRPSRRQECLSLQLLPLLPVPFLLEHLILQRLLLEVERLLLLLEANLGAAEPATTRTFSVV